MDTRLVKSLSRLTALKNNLPQKGWGVSGKYVEEFNSILEDLEKVSSKNLKEFNIPDNEVRPRMTSVDGAGHKIYTSESYCDKEYASMKIDGVLGYFTLLLQPTEIKNKLGFYVEKKD